MRPQLPKKANPLVSAKESPDYEELLSRRRLGQTKLTVKATQVGTSNATKPENLGAFEYAHLRAPLPKNLTGSEIFPTFNTQPNPESYFLMRRSKDGFVSATGMFKIAFPYAKNEEEKAEREYLKIKESTSHEEVAGNVWISPGLALELAEEYGMSTWIRALIDPVEIPQSPSSAKKQIKPPPKFDGFPAKPNLPPPSATKATKHRSTRSISPSKIASPAKKSGVAASPRKKQTKAAKDASLANANAASSLLQSALNDAASTADAESVNGDTVKVEVDSRVEVNGETQTTLTNVSVEIPAGSKELPLPDDAEKLLETAKKMVEEARSLEGETTTKGRVSKRKAEVDLKDLDPELAPPSSKKAKKPEEVKKRDNVRSRAVLSLAATVAIASALSYFS